MRRIALLALIGTLAAPLSGVRAGASVRAAVRLKSGVPVDGTLTNGAPVAYSFAAVAWHHVTIALTAADITSGGEAELSVLNPNGTQGCTIGFESKPTDCDFTPTGTGAASVVVEGMAGNPSTGTFTLVYARDVTGGLTAGVAKSGTITVPGQHATYTWSAVAGQHVAFAVTAANVTDGEAGLYAYNVDGALICEFGFETARSSCNYAPTETGTASIVIEGVGDVTPITGSFTLAYTYDVTGALTAGHRTPVTIKYQGQHAAFTWSARSGRHATFDITKAAMTGGGGTELYAYNPDGSLGCEVVFQTSPTDCTFTADGTGSGSVVVQAVDRYNADTGKFTLIQRNH